MPEPRGFFGVAASFVGLFLGAGVIGDGLARLLAPGSFLAEAAGLFALPVAFAGSLQAWYGLALLSIAPRLVAMLFGRGRGAAAPAGSLPSNAPLPGAFVFLPFSATAGILAGIFVGALSSTQPFLLVAAIFTSVGLLHGWAGWRLARAGYLMPPETV